MRTFVKVATTADLAEGSMMAVLVGDAEILLAGCRASTMPSTADRRGVVSGQVVYIPGETENAATVV